MWETDVKLEVQASNLRLVVCKDNTSTCYHLDIATHTSKKVCLLSSQALTATATTPSLPTTSTSLQSTSLQSTSLQSTSLQSLQATTDCACKPDLVSDVLDTLHAKCLEHTLNNMIEVGLCRVTLDFPGAVHACQVFQLVQDLHVNVQRDVVHHLNEFMHMNPLSYEDYSTAVLTINMPGVIGMDQMCLVYAIVEKPRTSEDNSNHTDSSDDSSEDDFVIELQVTDMYLSTVILTQQVALTSTFWSDTYCYNHDCACDAEYYKRSSSSSSVDHDFDGNKYIKPWHLPNYSFHIMLVCDQHVELWALYFPPAAPLQAPLKRQQNSMKTLDFPWGCTFVQYGRFVKVTRVRVDGTNVHIIDLVTQQEISLKHSSATVLDCCCFGRAYIKMRTDDNIEVVVSLDSASRLSCTSFVSN
jgi:hypothetical protein